MSQITTILLGVTVFSVVNLILVAVILIARSKLLPRGYAHLTINDDPARTLTVPVGGGLLNVLSENNIYLASACGGRGTCGQCAVTVMAGGTEISPAEQSCLTRQQIRRHYRLSCQMRVKGDIRLVVPAEAFQAHKRECTVRSNHNVASFIKELILELPEGEELEYRAGSYIQMEAPPHTVRYADVVIEEEYRPDWDKYNLWQYVSVVEQPVSRAYSIASYPDENGVLLLDVALAPPPPDDPHAPPGKMSSYLFSLKAGDKLTISGPYGQFFAQESDNEMIFVGGGSGVAPLRSIIYDQLSRLKTKRKMSLWYGARTLRDAIHVEDFESLAEEYDNFTFHIALSRPYLMKEWGGYTGYVQHCLNDLYLKDHAAPESCEYYVCGPPALVASVIRYLDDIGVEPEKIFVEDFG